MKKSTTARKGIPADDRDSLDVSERLRNLRVILMLPLREIDCLRGAHPEMREQLRKAGTMVSNAIQLLEPVPGRTCRAA
jgi:hypothetical protein